MTEKQRERLEQQERVWIPMQYVTMLVAGSLTILFIVGWVACTRMGQDISGTTGAVIVGILYPIVFGAAFPFFADTAKIRQNREEDYEERTQRRMSRRERRMMEDDSDIVTDYHDPG